MMSSPENSAANGRVLGTSGLTFARAVEIQRSLRSRLILKAPRRAVATVGGADVAFTAGREKAIAGVVLLSWPELELLDMAVSVRPVSFPYIPGLLSFREIPALAAAFSRLSGRPDVLFCDGQGFAHPRRVGLACHLGVVLAVPTIGCAKSVLVGEYDQPRAARGSHSPLVDTGEMVGLALRTRDNVRPVYVSAGHMMDLETAADLVLAAGRGYRLPEPTRRAHNLVATVKHAIASARVRARS